MTEGETRMCVASSVCEMRNSSRHFRIVLPGWSDKAISPAIFSRSGNARERARRRGLYKRVEDAIGGGRTGPAPFSNRDDVPSGSCSAIATTSGGELDSSVSAFASLGGVPGRVQVHLNLGILRGPKDMRGIEFELVGFLLFPSPRLHLELCHRWIDWMVRL